MSKERHKDNNVIGGWNYGGQAVMEGVMMRGAYHSAVAVRRPDNHEIVVKSEPVSGIYRGWLSKVLFLRGIPLLWDSLGLGMSALFYSAEIVGQAEDPDFTMERNTEIGLGALSLLVGIMLFMMFPSWLAGLIVPDGDLLFNVVEGSNSPLNTDRIYVRCGADGGDPACFCLSWSRA